MLASMYSAVSGLSVHQTKMDTIGNNVSNVNTYGFKSSRVTFSDVFYQNYAGASAPTTTQGGTNASQLGYGASLGTIDVLMTRGGASSTDRSLDVYINGDGFLPVQDSSGNTLYTRLGNFYFDVQGNLVDGNGNKALGITRDDNGVVQLGEDGTTTTSALEAINVAPEKLKELTSISIGATGAITAIQEGAPQMNMTSGTSWVKSATIDSKTNLSGSVNITNVKTSGASLVSPKGTDGTDLVTASVANAVNATTDPLSVYSANVKGDLPSGVTGITIDAEKFWKTMNDTTGNDKATYTLVCTDASSGLWSVKKGEELVAVSKTSAELGLTVAGTPTNGATVTVETGSSTALSGELTFKPAVNPAESTLTYTDADGNIKTIETGCNYEYVDPSNPTTSDYKVTVAVPTPFAGSTHKETVTFIVNRDYFNDNMSGVKLGAVTGKSAEITATVYNKGGEEQTITGNWNAGDSSITFGDQLTLNLDTNKFNKMDLSKLVNTKLGNVSSGDGTIYTIGQLALATFTNQDGLLEAGSSYYNISANSGAATISIPGENGTGSLKASSLEMSNVDLASEFTEMIFAQRGFQANSRVVTTSNTILEELVNLVR